MKILFTGGHTGGHFYPIIAVAQELKRLAEADKLIRPELYYFAPDPYSRRLLFEEGINYVRVPAGKWRRYFSLLNFTDLFKTLTGIVQAIFKVYWLYPDVVFAKGGFASFPVLLAARLLRIPVIIHESDSKPGRVNAWAGKFAEAVAVSYPEAVKYFKKKNNQVAVTGNPIRRELLTKITDGAHDFLKLEPAVPTILIIGGSQGAMVLNNAILDILPELTEQYQLIHQTGREHLEEITGRAKFILEGKPGAGRYHAYDYLNGTAMRMVAGVTNLVVSRAGSSVFEFANWELPTILIPIPETVSHDQRTNAYTYARSGAALVIEEGNLTPSVLWSEIKRLLGDEKILTKMKAGARQFKRPEAGEIIAKYILTIALEHEK